MKKVVKIPLSIIGGLLALVVAVGLVMFLMGKSKLDKTFEFEAVLTSVSSDSATIARGEHILKTRACRHCHGEDLSGRVVVDAPPFRLIASNLTSGAGGIGTEYSVAEWDRAIRNGVTKAGHGVIIMPSEAYTNLSDQDTEALIAYLRQIDPVDNELPPREIKTFGYIMLSMADSPMNVFEPGLAPKETPVEAPTLELGKYLATNTCEGCHGVRLDGSGPGSDPNGPPPPSLAAAASWSLDDFVTTLRTGVNPGGRQLNNSAMPWGAFKYLTDIELRALHMHLRHVFAAD